MRREKFPCNFLVFFFVCLNSDKVENKIFALWWTKKKLELCQCSCIILQQEGQKVYPIDFFIKFRYVHLYYIDFNRNCDSFLLLFIILYQSNKRINTNLIIFSQEEAHHLNHFLCKAHVYFQPKSNQYNKTPSLPHAHTNTHTVVCINKFRMNMKIKHNTNYVNNAGCFTFLYRAHTKKYACVCVYVYSLSIWLGIFCFCLTRVCLCV